MPLSSGDINQVYHCILKNHLLVIKLDTTKKYPTMFEKEKEGLIYYQNQRLELLKEISPIENEINTLKQK